MVTLTINGTSYSFPENGDSNWGVLSTAAIQALASNILYKSGGEFTLTADADFGSSYGLLTKYLKSDSSNIADSGVIRLANSDTISFRNSTNSGNLNLSLSGDTLQFNSVTLADVSSTQNLTNKTITEPIISIPYIQGEKHRSRSISADHVITAFDEYRDYLVTTSTNKITITLPPIAETDTSVLDKELIIMKIDSDSGYVCVDGYGSEQLLGKHTLDAAETASGALTYHIIGQYEGIKLKATTAGWYILNEINVKDDVGMVKSYSGDAATPAGYIACDGSSLLRAGKYARLFAAIGTNWGTADGTHFNVPDLKDAFLRGTGTSTIFTDNTKATRAASKTGGDTSGVGSIQNDLLQSHLHEQQSPSGSTGGALMVGVSQTGMGAIDNGMSKPPSVDGINGTPRTGKETAPKNAEVAFIIRI